MKKDVEKNQETYDKNFEIKKKLKTSAKQILIYQRAVEKLEEIRQE